MTPHLSCRRTTTHFSAWLRCEVPRRILRAAWFADSPAQNRSHRRQRRQSNVHTLPESRKWRQCYCERSEHALGFAVETWENLSLVVRWAIELRLEPLPDELLCHGC